MTLNAEERDYIQRIRALDEDGSSSLTVVVKALHEGGEVRAKAQRYVKWIQQYPGRFTGREILQLAKAFVLGEELPDELKRELGGDAP